MLQGELAPVGDEDSGFLWRPDLHVGAASHEHLPVPHLLRLAMPERHAPTKTLGERPTMHLGPIPYRHAGNSSSSSSMLSCSTSSKWLAHSRAIPSSPSLSDDLLKMFKDPALADVEIVCVGGEEQVFKVHRVILAARSPVFRAMFLTGMREERVRQVKVEDASAEAVKCMLYFAYTDGYPDLDQSNVFDVLKLANKYDIPGLTDHCVDWMSYNAHSENVVDILAACDCYSLHDFKHLLLAALLDKPAVLHECLHAQGLDSHPDLMKELLSLAAHKLSPASKERRVVKYFDGLPYRSRCSVCVREVASMSKQMLGEMLFPMVARLRPEFANKITGMILELDNMELVPLLESDHALREKVEEAMAVLRAVEETPSSLASSNSRGGDNARRGQQQRAARSGSGGGVIGEEVVSGGAVGGSGGAALSGSGAPYSEVAQDQESSESSGMEVFQDDTFLGL